MDIIGKNIIRLDIIESTNDHLKNSINSTVDFNNGDIVIASEQTQGKGRGENSWESEPDKNLTFSILLKPGFLETEQQFLLNKAISFGILEFINSIIKDQIITIKWPNDIYINDGKVAGILIDSAIIGNKISHSVVGIGININQLNFNQYLPNPISIRNFIDSDLDLDKCLISLCYFLNLYYKSLINLDFNKLDQSYYTALYRFNEFHKFKIEKNIIDAKIVGVNEFGKLQLETLERKKIEFDYSEIEFII